MKTINHIKQIAMAGIAAICVASAAMGAQADELNPPTRTVRYADLDLNTQAGVAVLYNRIKNAAEQVCGDVHSLRLDEAAAAKACVGQALYASVHSVNNVKLTDEYNAHLGVTQGSINVAFIR